MKGLKNQKSQLEIISLHKFQLFKGRTLGKASSRRRASPLRIRCSNTTKGTKCRR